MGAGEGLALVIPNVRVCQGLRGELGSVVAETSATEHMLGGIKSHVVYIHTRLAGFWLKTKTPVVLPYAAGTWFLFVYFHAASKVTPRKKC